MIGWAFVTGIVVLLAAGVPYLLSVPLTIVSPPIGSALASSSSSLAGLFGSCVIAVLYESQRWRTIPAAPTMPVVPAPGPPPSDEFGPLVPPAHPVISPPGGT